MMRPLRCARTTASPCGLQSGEAADFELCALPRGVHNYRIPLPEALAQVLHNIPCGMFLWDGECIVLTATGLDAEAMCDSTAPNAPGGSGQSRHIWRVRRWRALTVACGHR
jgi:hypothetical protein